MSDQQPLRRPSKDVIRSQSSRAGSSRPTPSAPTRGTISSIETPNASTQTPQTSSNRATTSPGQHFFRIPESPRSAFADAQGSSAKVAIPRLKRSIDTPGENAARSGGRHRVNHACEPCRHRKTKCSGERPICRHCQDFKIVCFYADGKRDRVKKQFGSMAEKVADYEKLLRDLSLRVSGEDARLIRTSLDKASSAEFDDTLTDTATQPMSDFEVDDEPGGGESEASAGAGSTGALDRTEEDFTREGARMTGFMGKNSDLTWLQRLKRENKFGGSGSVDGETEKRPQGSKPKDSAAFQRSGEAQTVPIPEAHDGFTIHDSSYHLDDLPVNTYEAVDAYEMPTAETAHTLFDTYMKRVHPTFPVVGQMNLTAQFRRYINSPVQSPPEKWLAIINMIFAIAARYSHLVQADWQGDERDHIIYFTRARLLAINQDTLFDHPDLQTIQIMGLMSFYLLSTSQVNRAWLLVGTALRAAAGLGLNMRNDSANLKDSLKEIRYRLWWSLYTLEHRLCSMTGRVNCVLDDHCTTPLPVPIDEDSFETEGGRSLLSAKMQQHDRPPASNSHSPAVPPESTPTDRSRSSGKSEQSRSPSAPAGRQLDLEWAKDAGPSASLYFLHLVQLTRLTQNIFHQLYNPTSVDGSWSFIQSRIKELDEQLEYWYRRLPAVLDFRRKQRDRDFYEFRLSLGFFFFATKEMVYRPCLCRLDRKIPNQSSRSQDFNRTSAMACVEAAQEMIGLIPDEPNAVGLIKVGPWWTVVHWLVQSATVLMLEISFRAHHMPEEADNILDSSKKAVRWLHALGADNLSAKRAWSLCDSMLHEAAAKIGRDVTDLPSTPPGRSDASSDSATNTTTSGQPGHGNPVSYSQQPGVAFSTFGTGASAMGMNAFAPYDQLMQYDQYFPNNASMNLGMSGNASMGQYSMPTDAEMEFMTNAYHDDSVNQGGQQNDMGQTGDRSMSRGGYMP